MTNTGGNTGNVPITDSVYLSFDQVLDPTDRYIGSVTEHGRPGRRRELYPGRDVLPAARPGRDLLRDRRDQQQRPG